MSATALRLILGATLTIAIPALLGGYAADRGFRSAEAAVSASRPGSTADAVIVPQTARDPATPGVPLAQRWLLHGADLGIDLGREPREPRQRF